MKVIDVLLGSTSSILDPSRFFSCVDVKNDRTVLPARSDWVENRAYSLVLHRTVIQDPTLGRSHGKPVVCVVHKPTAFRNSGSLQLDPRPEEKKTKRPNRHNSKSL